MNATCEKHQCPSCGGVMQEGFFADSGHNGGVRPLQWMPGEPEFQRLFGFKAAIIKLKGKTLFPVRSYCCMDCGYLKSHVILEHSTYKKPNEKIEETPKPTQQPREPESVFDTFPWTPE